MKVIGQETFDEVVLENIKDFDQPLEEAVAEAVKEFEAQGVQLSNIVKNLSISEDKEKVFHSILESLEVLKLKNSDASILKQELKKFQQQCNLSLAHRVLATKHQAYSILLALLKEFKSQNDIDLLIAGLRAMSSLTNTNPDILEQGGAAFMVELLRDCGTSLQCEELHEAAAKWCMECCLKHENNRQNLFEADVPSLLIVLLRGSGGNPVTAKTLSRALRSFTLDDDIRIEFGKAHDHARMLVEEHRLIEVGLDLIQDFGSDSGATSELLSTLSKLCVRTEYCQRAVDKGALKIINEILVSFPENSLLNQQSINLLKTISGNDRVKEDVMKIGAAMLIVEALVRHKNKIGVCEACLGAISMLALRVPNHANQLIFMGAADAVVQAMKLHPDSKLIQKLGCMATRNLAARVPENAAALIECQVEDAIHAALAAFSDDFALRDVAKGALRDLDLKVNLQEQWRGLGKEIEQ